MKKTVTLNLRPIRITVDGKDERELLENAELELKKMVSDGKFSYQYEVSDADILKEGDVKTGLIVKDMDGRDGIIYDYKPQNKRPISIIYKSGVKVSGSYECFKLSDSTFEEVRHRRQSKAEWYTGDSGYLKTKSLIVPILVGKMTKTKWEIWAMDTPGKYFTITPQQAKAFLRDEEADFL